MRAEEHPGRRVPQPPAGSLLVPHPCTGTYLGTDGASSHPLLPFTPPAVCWVPGAAGVSLSWGWDMSIPFILTDEGLEHPLWSWLGCDTPCVLWPCGTGPSPGSITYPWGHSPAPEKEGRRGPPVVWGGLQVPRTRAPAICFLQGSPFPFARCGRTEQTLMWSLSQVCFKTTKIQPLPPGSGFPWFPPDSPGAGWPQDAFPVSSWSERLVLEVSDPDSGVHLGQGDEIPELCSSNPNSCCSDPAAWGGPGSAVMLQLQNPSPNPLRSISR